MVLTQEMRASCTTNSIQFHVNYPSGIGGYKPLGGSMICEILVGLRPDAVSKENNFNKDLIMPDNLENRRDTCGGKIIFNTSINSIK